LRVSGSSRWPPGRGGQPAAPAPPAWVALLLVFAVCALCACVSGAGAGAERTYHEEVSAGLEEIYITRSTRTQYIRGATPACAAAAFSAASEQHYDMWSIRPQARDARLLGTHERPVGEFLACFGAMGPDGTFSAYTRGSLGPVSYSGTGNCRLMRSKPPAPDLLPLACTLDLADLPDGYLGGYMTTSSLAPIRDTHVRGFLSTSVITYRLWRTPPSR
jgi:hypothetical protein